MARNKIEELKSEKDGLDVLPDLYRYAVEGVEAIPADDLERLKWYGLFHRKATPGYFMLRIRIPNGVLTSEQIAAVGEIAGFNVLVGGALGGMQPELAQPLDAFVGPEGVVPLALAILETFRDHGPREQRKQARLKVLLAQWGIERFREAVEERLGSALARAGEPAARQHGGDHIGVAEQRQPGRNVVGCLVPVGRVSGDDLIEFGRLAAEYGTAELRLTVQQNVLIPDVADDRLKALLEEPLLASYSPQPSPWVRSLVTCTGNDYCRFSLIDTKNEALELARALDERYEIDEPVRIQMSGCPHACGQHRAGEIGLLGDRVRIDGEIRDAADVFAGGRLGEDARLGDRVAESVLTADLPEAVAAQLRALRGADALRPCAGAVAPAGAPTTDRLVALAV